MSEGSDAAGPGATGAGGPGIEPASATVFGALADYAKGGVQVIDDDPKNYVFSNVFEVAETSVPY